MKSTLPLFLLAIAFSERLVAADIELYRTQAENPEDAIKFVIDSERFKKLPPSRFNLFSLRIDYANAVEIALKRALSERNSGKYIIKKVELISCPSEPRISSVSSREFYLIEIDVLLWTSSKSNAIAFDRYLVCPDGSLLDGKLVAIDKIMKTEQDASMSAPISGNSIEVTPDTIGKSWSELLKHKVAEQGATANP